MPSKKLYYKIISFILKIAFTGIFCFFLFFRAKAIFKQFPYHRAVGHKMKLLMRRPTDYANFRNISEGKGNINHKKLGRYLMFYERAIDLFPQTASAHGLKGFCSYYLGQSQQAVDSYKKAIELYPNFFWFYYNLGTIYFREGRYINARENLIKAVKISPQETINNIFHSKEIYLFMLERMQEEPIDLQQQLLTGTFDAFEMILLSDYSNGDYKTMVQRAEYILTRRISKAIFLYYAGLAHFMEGHHDKARGYFNLAIQQMPKDSLNQQGLSTGLSKIDLEATTLKERHDFLKNVISVINKRQRQSFQLIPY